MKDDDLASVISSWYWCPPGSIVFDRRHYRLTLWNQSTERNIVDRFSTENGLEIVAEVEGLVRQNGRSTVVWQCKPGSRPDNMAELLQGKGYAISEKLAYLCFDMGNGRAPNHPAMRRAAGAQFRKVRTVQDAVQSLLVSEGAFADHAFSADEIRGRAETLLRESYEENSLPMVGSLDGKTVCSGGATVEGNILKLWGAGTHPDYRRRGLYGSLVIARCDAGFRLGARYVVVTAVETTSMPILLRAGFRRVGYEVHYRRRLS